MSFVGSYLNFHSNNSLSEFHNKFDQVHSFTNNDERGGTLQLNQKVLVQGDKNNKNTILLQNSKKNIFIPGLQKLSVSKPILCLNQKETLPSEVSVELQNVNESNQFLSFSDLPNIEVVIGTDKDQKKIQKAIKIARVHQIRRQKKEKTKKQDQLDALTKEKEEKILIYEDEEEEAEDSEKEEEEEDLKNSTENQNDQQKEKKRKKEKEKERKNPNNKKKIAKEQRKRSTKKPKLQTENSVVIESGKEVFKLLTGQLWVIGGGAAQKTFLPFTKKFVSVVGDLFGANENEVKGFFTHLKYSLSNSRRTFTEFVTEILVGVLSLNYSKNKPEVASRFGKLVSEIYQNGNELISPNKNTEKSEEIQVKLEKIYKQIFTEEVLMYWFEKRFVERIGVIFNGKDREKFFKKHLYFLGKSKFILACVLASEELVIGGDVTKKYYELVNLDFNNNALNLYHNNRGKKLDLVKNIINKFGLNNGNYWNIIAEDYVMQMKFIPENVFEFFPFKNVINHPLVKKVSEKLAFENPQKKGILIQNSDPKIKKSQTIVCLNCGGNSSISQLLNAKPDWLILICDSHRPINLDNVVEDKVIIFGDGTIKNSLPKTETVNFKAIKQVFGDIFDGEYDEESSSSEEDEESEDEDEFENEKDQENEDENDPLLNMSVEELEKLKPEELELLRKRKTFTKKKSKTTKGKKNKRKKKKRYDREFAEIERDKHLRNEKLLSDYYSSSYYGTGASILLFALATQLGRKSGNLLWYAISGLTDQYLHYRINEKEYRKLVNFLHKEVVHLYPSDNIKQPRTKQSYSTTSNENDLIRKTEDYRFMLYRFWNLYDSMYHSTYIASRLGVWCPEGLRNLNTFLAKMGFSHEKCKQRYDSMDLKIKSKLHEKLKEHAKNFGLKKILFPSFYRKIGFQREISSSDLVYCVTSLLEHGDKTFSDEILKNNNEREITQKKFWLGYDTLSSPTTTDSIFDNGVKLAIQVQKAIVKQGTAMIERNQISSSPQFRHSFITELSGKPEIFRFPLILTRLGGFLLQVMNSVGKTPKPLILCCLQPKSERYLVVGLLPGSEAGIIEKNKFGKLFHLAAEKTRAKVKHDGFESSAIEVSKVNIRTFMEFLNVLLG
ncbi:cdc45-related protein [Anaeramoeba flamelloides]|uniref:Cdc45-related protein n=1 Tax=Anaeramoeba flamelloides TaxID=1746091 RepID=A0AAV7YVU6_9EUKA|nr:cdc45-related protein [Anaeramoeba flamelloides]